MHAFAPTISLPGRASVRIGACAAPRTVPRAALRAGWGARPAVPRDFSAKPRDAAPAELAPLPVKESVELARVTSLQKFLRGVVALSQSLKAFRLRHARSLGVARLALGAVIGFAVLAARGGGGGLAIASSSGAAVAAAPAQAAALPGALSALPLPESLVRAVRPFSESFGVVFLSEFGDKSMFATALMAMKHSPVLVLIGALAALTVMTLIACFLGQLMQLLPSTVTHYSSIALFVFFGFQMIMQSRSLPSTPGGKGGERADAEELVAGSAIAVKQSPFAILAKISSLIFVAEWCDRSMIATMALAASSNSLAVVGGATLANVVCTGFAVGAAALVASRISERTVALTAGILFEFFAVFTFFEGPES